MKSLRKALFLDRDGIINEDVGYPYRPDQIVFVPAIFSLCKRAIKNDYIIVVITNQAGIAKGLFKETDVEKLHQWMKEIFLQKGIAIDGFYYCPFSPQATVEKYRMDSNFRKPKPGMFLQAAEDLQIDLAKSIMIGDKESDRIELPELRSILVKSSYLTTPGQYDVESIEDVADLIFDRR